MASTDTLPRGSDKYVVVRTISPEWALTCDGIKPEKLTGTSASGPFSLPEARYQFSLATATQVYTPHTGNRIRVMTQDEWKRVGGGMR